MNLYWKITVWVNLIWIIFAAIWTLSNNTFGWLFFVYFLINAGTAIKCLELAKDNEIKDRRIKELKNKVTLKETLN